MSDEFNIVLNLKTSNIRHIQMGFNLLEDYIISEHNTSNILSGIAQITPLFTLLFNHKDISHNFMDTQRFNNFYLKLKFLSSYSECSHLLNLIEGDSKNITILKKDLDNYFYEKNDSQKLFLANAYLDFYDTLKTSLDNKQYSHIKESWNKNCDFFESDRITHTVFTEKFPDYTFSKDIYTKYFKLIKLAQEKIVELLWNNFLHNPETIEPLSKFSPDFFQFIDWLEKSDKTTQEFVGLLEQKHFDHLSYASQVQGFDYFLESLLLLKKNKLDDLTEDFDPFANEVREYKYINLDTIQKLNEKNINIDVVLKANSFGVPTHLRDYLYHHIKIFESNSIKYSSTEFHELDKLLIIYEKQKMESIFIPKNDKVKTHKI